MKLLIISLCICGLVSVLNAAKILCIFPHSAHSHYTIGFTLAKGLAARGHHVTFMAPKEEEKPTKNVKSVFLKDVKKYGEEMFDQKSIFDIVDISAAAMVVFMGFMGVTSTEIFYSDQAMQEMLVSNETFDAVIAESFTNDALLGVAYRFKAPSIVVTTIGPSIWSNYFTANPTIYSYMPHPFLGYGQKMTFCQRTHNLLLATLEKIFNMIYYFPQQDKILHKYIPEAPSLQELIQNTSLHIFNSDPSINGPFPILPNIIEIGGIHLTPPKKLPDDLQTYLDESKNGAIYFSLGGNLKSKDLPQATREAILRVLAKQKERILWKFEEDLPGKPKNVQIRKWMPQQDILAHPNVKLFITHGGLLSTTESLYHGVPVIGISVFGDQDLNMKNAENRGYGISLPYMEFTEEKFEAALNKMLNNPDYSNNAKQMSILMKDKQVSQMDKATYSIEYVIRHKGSPHLRSAAHDLNWFQYLSLDV
ncbi:Glycosyltransferase, partial [Oryctes borbonicus]